MYIALQYRTSIVVVLCTLIVPAANAVPVDVVVNEILDQFFGQALSDTILTAAKSLFWSLATISLVWTMGAMIIRHDIGELLMELLRFVIVSGIFYWLLVNASVHQGGQGFVDSIVRSFLQMPNDDPSDALIRNNATSMFMRGMNVFAEVINGSADGSMSDNLLGGGMAVAILVVCTIMSAQFILALIMAWILGYAGIFLLGFGGARWTSQVAINFYKHVVALGAALMALSIIGTVAVTYLNNLSFDSRGSPLSSSQYSYLGLMLGTSVLMLILSIKVPQMLYTLVTGSTLGLYAGSASAAGIAIANASSSAYAAAAGRLPGGGGGSGGMSSAGAGDSAPYRTGSVMDAVQRSASVAGGMADPFHVGSGSDPFGAARVPDPHRGSRGGSVFGSAQVGRAPPAPAVDPASTEYPADTPATNRPSAMDGDSGRSTAVGKEGSASDRYASSFRPGDSSRSGATGLEDAAGDTSYRYGRDTLQADNGRKNRVHSVEDTSSHDAVRPADAITPVDAPEALDMMCIDERVSGTQQSDTVDTSMRQANTTASSGTDVIDMSPARIKMDSARLAPQGDSAATPEAIEDDTLYDARERVHTVTSLPADSANLVSSQLPSATPDSLETPRIDDGVRDSQRNVTVDQSVRQMDTAVPSRLETLDVPRGVSSPAHDTTFIPGAATVSDAADMPRIDDHVGHARQDDTQDDARHPAHAVVSAPVDSLILSPSQLAPVSGDREGTANRAGVDASQGRAGDHGAMAAVPDSPKMVPIDNDGARDSQRNVTVDQPVHRTDRADMPGSISSPSLDRSELPPTPLSSGATTENGQADTEVVGAQQSRQEPRLTAATGPGEAGMGRGIAQEGAMDGDRQGSPVVSRSETKVQAASAAPATIETSSVIQEDMKPAAPVGEHVEVLHGATVHSPVEGDGSDAAAEQADDPERARKSRKRRRSLYNDESVTLPPSFEPTRDDKPSTEDPT